MLTKMLITGGGLFVQTDNKGHCCTVLEKCQGHQNIINSANLVIFHIKYKIQCDKLYLLTYAPNEDSSQLRTCTV